jgi:hypothetical protein
MFDCQAPEPELELRYESLHQSGHAFSFPCNANGEVDLNALGERLRGSYFFVRALVGREFTYPCVVRRHCGDALRI